jgi:hypothetical protein
MTGTSNTWITAIVVFILFAAIFYFGYAMRGVWNPAPVPIHDTIIKVDTVHHTIISEYPYYISKIDTVILRDTIPAIVDTAAILQKYFAYYTYSRSWNDSLLSVSLTDVITENKVMDSQFSYQILRPQEIINNTNISYSYSRYLYLGTSITLPDAKWSSLAVFFASKRALYGIGYIPLQRGLNVTGAITIGKFK